MPSMIMYKQFVIASIATYLLLIGMLSISLVLELNAGLRFVKH